jgi:hypothetical protein
MGQADTETAAKITPAMIDAGVDELIGWNPEDGESEVIVRWIFEAMMQAQPLPTP